MEYYKISYTDDLAKETRTFNFKNYSEAKQFVADMLEMMELHFDYQRNKNEEIWKDKNGKIKFFLTKRKMFFEDED